jgi:aryl-alcohol dehydrogenase
MTVTKAAVLRTPDGSFTVEDIELGPLGYGEVLVRVVGAGMCHTDLAARSPVAAQLLPVILGHEGSGVVEEVGAGVTRVRPGDHVLLSFDSCGWCASCLQGAPSYCAEFAMRNLTGRRADGSTAAVDPASGSEIANRWFAQSSFAQHSIATERNLVVVDPELPLEILGPLGCGLQTGAGSVLNEMRLTAGKSIVVFGVGAVGLGAVMAARLAGASDIVAVDLVDSRLNLALEVGATRVVRGNSDDIAAEVRDGGAGVDFSFDTTGISSVMAAAISSLGQPGKAVLVAAGSDQLLSVPPTSLVGRTVTFAFEGSSVPQVFLPQLVSYWKKGLFPFDRLIRTYPLSEIDQAEKDSLSGQTVKPVLLPQDL